MGYVQNSDVEVGSMKESNTESNNNFHEVILVGYMNTQTYFLYSSVATHCPQYKSDIHFFLDLVSVTFSSQST